MECFLVKHAEENLALKSFTHGMEHYDVRTYDNDNNDDIQKT